MAEKRKRSAEASGPGQDVKKRKRGFVVGPANLPDGVYKRKTQEIKRSLIDKAKTKQNYAKLKRQGKISDQPESMPQPASAALDEEREPTTAPHPDRQILMDKDEEPEVPKTHERREREARPKKRRPKIDPLRKEYEQAQQRKTEADERRQAREKAERERYEKIKERERFRRAMAKARTGGPNGQRKLGRESNVLLEKVKRMVGGGGG